jgi:ribonuclease P protein component
MQKRFRLTRNEDFKAVIVQKVSASNRSFVGYVGPNTCGHARVGISIRAHYGHAVARNRAKRQVRAMSDQLVDFSKSLDFVFIIRDAFQTRTYAENYVELTYLYQKLLSKR